MTKSTLGQLAKQERTRREILNRSELIPPLPDVVVKVLSLLNAGDSEPEELEEHLKNDQVLVAKILGMVNSPFYGLNRQVTSVSNAVMVLGFRGLRSLLLASTAAEFMSRDFSCYGHVERGLWLHALAVGTATKWIARKAGATAAEVEEYFVAGLLHDIGKMLVMPYLFEQGASYDPASGKSLVDLEIEVVGVDHREAGGLVAAKWNLSSLVQECLKHHHYTGDVDPEGAESALAAVRIADAFANGLGTGYEPEFTPQSEYRPEDFATLGISEDDWAEYEPELVEEVETAIASLSSM